jgi:hypothetical protein
VGDVMQRAGHSVLEGWKAICEFLARLSGIQRSEDTLQRYARRRHDPLPIIRTPGGRIVVATPHELEAWWKRHSITY